MVLLCFVTEPSFSPRDIVLYCTNLHSALTCQRLYGIRLHLRYSCTELCTDAGLGCGAVLCSKTKNLSSGHNGL